MLDYAIEDLLDREMVIILCHHLENRDVRDGTPPASASQPVQLWRGMWLTSEPSSGVDYWPPAVLRCTGRIWRPALTSTWVRNV